MTELTLHDTTGKAPPPAAPIKARAARDGGRGVPPPDVGASPTSEGCRADPFLKLPQAGRIRRFRFNSPYSLGAFVGVITYLSYGYLNHAWTNWVLFAISLFMFLSLPLYSKYSNRIESLGARWTRLETGGRVARYLFQLLDNTLILWFLAVGQVIDPAALSAIGGFFATAAWVTIVSQGGQYVANYLARRGFGTADHNVVWAVTVSVSLNALAVSGVAWIQPAYVAVSLGFGALIFGLGVVADTKRVLKRHDKIRVFGREV